MVHDGVGDQSDLENIFQVSSDTLAKLNKQIVQSATNNGGHFPSAFWVHHNVRHPAHKVFTKPNLWIHDTRGPQNFAIA